MRCPSKKDLIAVYYGEGDEALKAHIGSCAHCQAEYKKIDKLLNQVKLSPIVLSEYEKEQMVAGVLAKIRQPETWQIKLGRLWENLRLGFTWQPRAAVALAMILAALIVVPRWMAKQHALSDMDTEILAMELELSLDDGETVSDFLNEELLGDDISSTISSQQTPV